MSDITATPRDQGMSMMKLGRFAEAVQALTRAVELDPADEMSWRLLGGARASLGDKDGAVQAFRRSLEMTPTSSKSHYNLAIALQSLGQSYEAKTHLERALSLDPNYEQARIRLDDIKNSATNSSYGPVPTDTGRIAGIGGGGEGLSPISFGDTSTKSTNPDQTSNNLAGDSAGLAPIGAGFLAAAASSESRTVSPNTLSGDTGGLAGIGGGTFAPSMAAPPPLPPRPVLGAPTSAAMPAPVLAPPASYSTPALNQPMMPPPLPVLGMERSGDVNTSGAKSDAPIDVAGGWNWGAFYFTWIWLFAHSLPAFAIGLIVLNIVLLFIPIIGPILFLLSAIIVPIVLGINGNKMGWQNRRFNGTQDFFDCQRIWARWALGMFILGVFTTPITAAILFPVFAQARLKAQQARQRQIMSQPR